jgi:uncharacterized damage-inducible protein DinB
MPERRVDDPLGLRFLSELLPPDDVSRDIGFYLAGMEEVREQVREAVTDLAGEKFNRPAFLGAHSVGALVMHLGEAEWWWMQCHVAGHKLTAEDRKAPCWDVLKEPDAFASRAYTAEFCLQEIEKIRGQTRELLASFNDTDLERIISYQKRGVTHEQSLRWILHHLIDHEAQHKGQILMLTRLMAG